MNNFYTFIVTSTINASSKLFDIRNRYEETLKTLTSIRSKVNDSRIIFIDNSLVPLTDEQKKTIDTLTDVAVYLKPNLFFNFSNNTGLKSIGEAFILYEAIHLAKQHNLLGKRIFKLSGRYFLSDTFDISVYDDRFIGKYAFRKTIHKFGIDANPFPQYVYETMLVSFCPTLVDEYLELIPVMFSDMLLNILNSEGLWEVSNYKHVPQDKVVAMDKVHIEGWNSGYYLVLDHSFLGPRPTSLTYVKS